MRYSQPYGTPEPPLGSYPRYINGDPVTGTEGSIPPATSIDEDQIEIINVITNAGLTPSHSDLQQLWEAITGLIAQKFITTSITKTVHGVGADFPDLNSAFTWLGSYIITSTGSVTFMIAPGKWTYTATVEINHPNSNRVSIQGAALKGAAPSVSTFSYTSPHNATDGTNDIIALRNVFSTELSFTGGVTGFHTLRGECVLRYLLITGSQTISSGGGPPAGQNRLGNGILVNATLYVDTVSIWGFGRHGVYVESSALFVLTTNALCLIYNGQYGIYALNALVLGTFATGHQLICASNGGAGLNLDGSNATGWQLIFRCNGSVGVAVEQGSQLSGQQGCQIMGNSGDGIEVVGGVAVVEYTTITGNGGWGVWCAGGTIWADYSTVSGNGVGALSASASAYVEATGCALGGQVSPPLNTYNQGSNSYISY
jgi:hypothetical protein